MKDLSSLQAIRQDWNELAAAAEECWLCLSYQYCELAASLVLDRGADVVVAMVFDDVGLCAIWPLAIHRQGLFRIARGLTCGSAEEYGGPLVRGAADLAVVAKALDAVMQVRADIIEVVFVQDGSLLHEALKSVRQSWLLRYLPHRIGGLAGYSIKLRDFRDWDDFMSSLPRSLRANLRRRANQLRAKGCTEIGWCQDKEDAHAVLTWLFANKRRWAEARGLNTKYLMEDRTKEFFDALSHRLDLSTTPLVAFVKVDGVPVAASVNLVNRRSVEYFITTYDEAFSRFAVGILLVEFVAKWSHAAGRDFDFRPLYVEYKAHWANHDTFHKTTLVFLSVSGHFGEVPVLIRMIFSSLAWRANRFASRLREALPLRFKALKRRLGLASNALP